MTNPRTTLRTASCRCGHVVLEATGEPILTAACYCDSCRAAGRQFEALDASKPVVAADGGTAFVLQRKDRLRCVKGSDALREHYLKADSTTRRVVATCCNTPMFLEFRGGHWLSLYAATFPADQRPPVEMRTMVKDLGPDARLPNDIPNYRTPSGKFMWRLFTAWVAMGFRAPKIDWVKGRLAPG
jgi:hypothetical protein